MVLTKPRTRLGVMFATMLTTFFFTVSIVSLVALTIDEFDAEKNLVESLIVTTCVAFPLCFGLWTLLQRNVLLSDRLADLVNRDRLTDVATRDFFFSRMENATHAYGVSLMIDIDYFKRINDTYGHFAGDVAIQTVAQVLKEQTKPHDIVCRFGGEEFMVFLTDQSALAGYKMAETLRKAIAARLIVFEDIDFHLTVSIGGSLKERVADINVAIKQADDALYHAKRLGRNKTVFSSLDDVDDGVRQSA